VAAARLSKHVTCWQKSRKHTSLAFADHGAAVYTASTQLQCSRMCLPPMKLHSDELDAFEHCAIQAASDETTCPRAHPMGHEGALRQELSAGCGKVAGCVAARRSA